MKRISIFSLLLFIILSIPLDATASDTEKTAKVTCIPYQGAEKGLYEVEVYGEGVADVSMVQFTVCYDPQYVECISASAGSILLGKGTPTINTAKHGKVYFIWESINEIEEDGNIMTLTFRILSSDSESFVNFDYNEEFIVADSQFKQYTVQARGTILKNRLDTEVGSRKDSIQVHLDSNGSNQGLTLNKNYVSLRKGATVQLTVAEEDQIIFWESSNEAVGIVKDGVVTGLNVGQTIVSVTCENGEKTATCTVSVYESIFQLKLILFSLILLGTFILYGLICFARKREIS